MDSRRQRGTRGAALIAAACVALLGARARAEPTSEAEAYLRDHGIELVGAFPDEVVEALSAGVQALPRALRTPPGGPLEIRYSSTPRPYGHDGAGEVGPALPATSERARFRLGELTGAERQQLWWRRAAIHLVISRWDRARGVSDSPSWRRVALWEAGGPLGSPRPRSLDPWSVSRPEGAESPRLDLLTFAEEAFAPATSIREDAVPADATVRCQERAKWRFLFETLQAENLADYRPHGECPAFDRWADLEHLESVEVMLVAASSRRPESLFGHLMLRPVYGPGARVESPGFQTVVQIIALTSKSDGAIRYMWRGITGHFPMVVATTTLASIRRGELDLEQRDVRRFRLRLTERERARLMDRVWDLERLGAFEYRFFSQNCATALVWLVSGALDAGTRIELPSAPWVLPAAVLDQMAAAELRRDGEPSRPLLEPVPGTLLSTGSRARQAHERRERVAARLPEALRPIHRASLDPDPQVRRRAYEALPSALEASGAPRLAYEWLALTARVERYLADTAAARALEARAAEAGEQEDPHERLARRRAWLQRDPSRTRRLSALVWESGPSQRSFEAPRTAAEQTFYRLTELQTELIERHWPEADPRGWIEAEDERAAAAEAAWTRRAVPRSGAGRRVLGIGALDGGPAVVIGGAPLGTYLGEALGHGYRPETEVRILDGRAWLVPGDGWPVVARSDVTFLGLRTIGRDLPPARRGLLDHLGWSLAIRWDRDRDHAFADRLSLDGELLWIGDSRLRASAHTIAGVGFSAQGRWSGERLGAALAPTISFSHRAPVGGSLMNALRLDVRAAPAAVVTALRPELDLDLEAETRIALDLYAGRAFGRALIAGPELALGYRPQAGHEPRTAAFLRLHIL